MTIEQKFLKSRGIVNFTNHHFVGIENSPIKETDLAGHEVLRLHFKKYDPFNNKPAEDVYYPIIKLDKPYHALNSGFYIINGEITEILV